MSLNPIVYNGYNAGITNKYPYTDFHEMNLDWLLTNYKAIIDKLNETIDWCNNHQTEYEEAMRRLQAVENEIYTFEQQITDAFNRLEQQITADVERIHTEGHWTLQFHRSQSAAVLKGISADTGYATGNYQFTGNTAESGSDGTNKNLPPYLAVYM